MTDEQRVAVEAPDHPAFAGWCCSYCSKPLEEEPHGLFCRAEGRWFATQGSIHRLLTEERRREIQAAAELDQRVRRDESRALQVGGQADSRLAQADELVRAAVARVVPLLPEEPWSVLQVGAGDCRASLLLVREGHRAVAVDVNLDPETGLPAADRLLPAGAALPRAEAEIDSLPLEPGLFDLVLAVGSLHGSPHLVRTLVELRRVTRRGGLLLILASPVYRRREEGEASVAERMRDLERRYRLTVVRESQPGYLVLGELEGAFRAAGWSLEISGWPGRFSEGVGDVVSRLRNGRASARVPTLLARREG